MLDLLTRALVLSGLLASLVPAWHLAGKVTSQRSDPVFRLLVCLGLDLVAFVTTVNLLGRWLERSIPPLLVFAVTSLALAAWRLAAAPIPIQPRGRALRTALRQQWTLLGLAALLAVPQAMVALSTNLWDETASSALHLTAVNQIAEDLFPPRHNALPDVPIKYHYASKILSGTIKWMTGIHPSLCVDLATIGLWLFIFLFVLFWLRDLRLGRFASLWGSFTVLLGGGLSWLFLPRLETYGNFSRTPIASELSHRFNPELGWLENLLTVCRHQNFHLNNADGTHSLVPLDVANFLQQHPAPFGIALTVLGLFLFERWVRSERFDLLLLVCNISSFGLLFLAHAVYAAVACVAAGLFLAGRWLWRRGWRELHEGVLFTAGTTLVAFLNGGLLAVGPEYGPGSLARLRQSLLYAEGGLRGFLEWNLAGFGLPQLFAVAAVALVLGRPGGAPRQKLVVGLIALFAFVSYSVPQVMFYTSSTSALEQFTEIAKFFFCTHTGLALLSAFAIDFLRRRWPATVFVLVPSMVVMAIVPVAFCYANAFYVNRQWNGIYRSPHGAGQVEVGRTLARMKRGNRETFFDASAEERATGYLSELLISGGSVFTLTPSRYERTGSGYRLSKKVVAERLVDNSRMARLQPGAAEQIGCRWLYARPQRDFGRLPVLVRSRLEKAIAEGILVQRAADGDRNLYSIEGATADLDLGIERYWRPSLVTQIQSDRDADGRLRAAFFDTVGRVVQLADRRVELPSWLEGPETPVPFVGFFRGDRRLDLLFARLADTVYDPGDRQGRLVEYDGWHWSYLDSRRTVWDAEYLRWLWGPDVPLVADVDGDGFDDHLAYRHTSGEWFLAPTSTVPGPKMDSTKVALPFAGRFFADSGIALGLWSPADGSLELRGTDGNTSTAFRWGGEPGDVLVPGDYDGDGLQEVGLWRRSTATWFFKSVTDGSIRRARFGSPEAVPVPADYDGDGTVDLAVWEPASQRILVSLDRDETPDLLLEVPPHSIPLVANFY